MTDFTFRNIVQPEDRTVYRKIMESTGLFYDFEMEVALEIMDLFLKDGEKTGYYFIMAELEGKTTGIINYGPTPCTRASWDIYWMAVQKDLQGKGLGSMLLEMAENHIASEQGENIWIETSGRSDYLPTRMFYLKNRYEKMCELPDFYAREDSKCIYGKYLRPSGGNLSR